MRIKILELIVAAALFFCLFTPAVSAIGVIEWQKVLGGSSTDGVGSILQTSDGGYILTGYTYSSNSGDVGANHGNSDVWVVKLTSTGIFSWQKVLGGSSDEYGHSIQQTSDGGYILTGNTYSSNSGDVGANHGDSDVWVVKLTPKGRISWQRVLGGSQFETARSIQQTSGGGYILTGYTYSNSSGDVGANHGNSDVWVVKLTQWGTIVWQRVLGGSNSDDGHSIQQTSDGGYILTGSTSSSSRGDVGANHGWDDVWVVKLNSAGTLQWQKVLGGSGSEYGAGIQQTSDGGYILTGDTSSSSSGDVGANHGHVDVWVVKLDTAGTLKWQRVLGGSSVDGGYNIRQTSDGGYILTGITSSNSSGDVGANHGWDDVWVVKLNSAGTLQWQKLLGGSSYELGLSIQQTSDGGYILTGDTFSSSSGDVGANHGHVDVWVVKLRDMPVISLPGCMKSPTDPDHDGIYEDLNGNGRLDFADVVLYFNQMTWIAANEPIAAFDLNGNGRIDFADIVALFNEI